MVSSFALRAAAEFGAGPNTWSTGVPTNLCTCAVWLAFQLISAAMLKLIADAASAMLKVTDDAALCAVTAVSAAQSVPRLHRVSHALVV